MESKRVEIRYVDAYRQAKKDGKTELMRLCLTNRKRVLQKEIEQRKGAFAGRQ